MTRDRIFYLSMVVLASSVPGVSRACGSIDQLVAQSQTVVDGFGDLNNPAAACASKPAESVLDSLISCLEASPSLARRDQSNADLQLSGLYGAITQCYRSGLGQRASGKKSFADLEDSTQADSTNEPAWLAFGQTVGDMSQRSAFDKKLIQTALGISIDTEISKAIQGLENLPQDEAVTAELAKLQSLR